jgi:hypothetical protein
LWQSAPMGGTYGIPVSGVPKRAAAVVGRWGAKAAITACWIDAE